MSRPAPEIVQALCELEESDGDSDEDRVQRQDAPIVDQIRDHPMCISVEHDSALGSSPSLNSELEVNWSPPVRPPRKTDKEDGYDTDSRKERLAQALTKFFAEIVDILSETNENSSHKPLLNPKPLNIKELRVHANRCLSASHQYFEAAMASIDIVLWKSPLNTLAIACLYVYCSWHGYLWSLLLILLIAQMLINYLDKHKKIDLGISFLPAKPTERMQLEWTGATLVMELSKYAQLALEIMADLLEKINSLMQWRKPMLSAAFLATLCTHLLLISFMSASTYIKLMGLIVGFYVLMCMYLYYRFPRLAEKVDPFHVILSRLPADGHPKTIKSNTDKHTVNAGMMALANFGATSSSAFYVNNQDEDDVTRSPGVRVRFNPPAVVIKITDRRCTIYDKDKSFLYRLANGMLMLTKTSIVFKYSRKDNDEHQVITIHLAEIISLIKTHSFGTGLFPGSGTAIEVYTTLKPQPYMFTAISRRDSFCEQLVQAANNLGVHITYHDKEKDT